MSSVIERFYGGVRRKTMVLAPMVRAGTLPLRLMCHGFGADLVYTEEIIDHKMLKTKRVEREEGFIDYVMTQDESKLVFRTCALEKDKVVFQVGTSDAGRAVKVAEMLSNDIAAFDVNMGCPKPFSVKGGMGSALLRTPEIAEDIIKTLRRNITNIPITCKIRLLETDAATIELVKRLEAAGAQAIGIHMRETHHRPREPALWERLHPIVEAVQVPIIANGDVYTRKDAEEIMEKSGASSAMFARGALRNPSVFSPDGELPLYDVLRQYTRVSYMVDNILQNTVYTLTQMLRYNSDSVVRGLACNEVIKKPKVQYEELLDIFDLTKEDCTLPSGPLSWETFGFPQKNQTVDTVSAEDKKENGDERDDNTESRGGEEERPRKLAKLT